MVRLIRALRMFAPNGVGDGKVLTDLALQAASQPFPFLAQFAAAYCERQAREFTANDFCAHLKPKIRPVPKRRPALLAACARPVAKMVSRKTVMRQPKEFTKRQLYVMLAEAVRNTG